MPDPRYRTREVEQALKVLHFWLDEAKVTRSLANISQAKDKATKLENLLRELFDTHPLNNHLKGKVKQNA